MHGYNRGRPYITSSRRGGGGVKDLMTSDDEGGGGIHGCDDVINVFCERTPYMPGACFNLELCRD